MGESAIKQRQRYVKRRTLANLRAIYPHILTQQVPEYIAALYFVPKVKGFFAVCLDTLSEKAESYLKDLRRASASDVTISVHIYSKTNRDAEKIDM